MPLFDNLILQKFLDHLKYEKRYSHHTIISYENDLTNFITFLDNQFGETKIEDITHTYVRSWLANLKENKMISRSINRKISSLKSFFKYQMKLGTLKSSPMTQVTSPKNASRLPVFIREDTAADLLATANSSSEDWNSLNTKMLVNIFYTTGMRLSELINLKEKQIDTQARQVKVLGKGNKERIIPVSGEIIAMIEDYQALKKKEFGPTGDQLLVTGKGRKLYPRYAYALVNKFLQNAPTLDKKSPHILRHTFATHLMNNGADLNAVKELLGHSSLASTQVYTHNTIEKLKDVYKKAHPKA